jgi:hypothetical protein
LPSNYGKSLNYQVAPEKTGLISRGEHHSLSWQFAHMRDRKRVRSRQRSLPRFPAQIETSVSREVEGLKQKKCGEKIWEILTGHCTPTFTTIGHCSSCAIIQISTFSYAKEEFDLRECLTLHAYKWYNADSVCEPLRSH